MSADDQKLDVIRKLLAKAEGAATPEEATAYNAKAAEMMARHGVSMRRCSPPPGPGRIVSSSSISP